MVFPKLGTSDPPLRLEGHLTVPGEAIELSVWVANENRTGGHVCGCGCGELIRVLPQHRAKGIPKFVRAHHPMATTKEVQEIRAAGLLTTAGLAQVLGIGQSTLRRLEGKLFDAVARRGKRKLRVFTPEQVEALRTALRETTRLGNDPELISFEEVARRAGCSASSIRRCMGAELPVGRQLTAGARPRRGFTPDEAKKIVDWASTRFAKKVSALRSRRRVEENTSGLGDEKLAAERLAQDDGRARRVGDEEEEIVALPEPARREGEGGLRGNRRRGDRRDRSPAS